MAIHDLMQATLTDLLNPGVETQDIGQMSTQDQQIYRAFVDKEWKDSKFFRTHPKHYRVNSESANKPIKSLAANTDKLFEFQRIISDETYLDVLTKADVNPEMVQLFVQEPEDLINIYAAMRDKVAEQIVAYAHQIGNELGQDPARVVLSKVNREDIYRRIFPTRDHFEFYATLEASYSTLAFNTLSLLTHELLEHDSNIGRGDWMLEASIFLTQKFASRLLPTQEENVAFLKDSIAYNTSFRLRLCYTLCCLLE
ncbi:MAG: hypothetical protein HGA85_03895, partial [Nanoarchaeota archaeon]|nr:hypothetical protein [Nanoarchaeota archaeon]